MRWVNEPALSASKPAKLPIIERAGTTFRPATVLERDGARENTRVQANDLRVALAPVLNTTAVSSSSISSVALLTHSALAKLCGDHARLPALGGQACMITAENGQACMITAVGSRAHQPAGSGMRSARESY